MLSKPLHRVVNFILVGALTLGIAAIPSVANAVTDASAAMTSIVNGSPVADGSVVAETSTVTIATSALLTPGLDTRTITTTLDSGTVFETSSAVAPEGWAIEYSTDGTTWTGTQPSAASVRAVRAQARVAAGEIQGKSQIYSSESLASIPSNNFSASTGGDGWDTFFSEDYVFNIFHHNNGAIVLDCHLKASGDRCSANYRATFAGYMASMRSGGWYDAASGNLYLFTAKSSNGEPGVLCVRATLTPTDCGFTSTGDGQIFVPNYDYLTEQEAVGRRVFGVAANGSGWLNCFDAELNARCSGSPIQLVGATRDVESTANVRPLRVGNRIIVKTTSRIYCFVASTLTTCSGSWPVTITPPGNNAGSNLNKTPLAPHTNGTGTVDGVCHEGGCINLNGETTTAVTPFSLGNDNWAMHAVVGTLSGTRYLWAAGPLLVKCFDYATNAACTGAFSKSFAGFSLIYSVRTDPVDGNCLWVNSDGGLIRNFDATLGTNGCTSNPVITLQPSQFAPRYACSTSTGISEWTTLKLVEIAGGGTADTVTLTVRDALGNVVTGWQNVPVKLGVPLDMTGLDVALSGSRPTFSFAFSGITGSITTASIALDYKGAGPELCIKTTLSAANASGTSGTCPAVTYAGSLVDQGGSFVSNRTLLIASGGNSCVQNLVIQTVPETVTALSGTGLNTTATLRFRPPINTGGLPLLGFSLSTNSGANWSDSNATDNGDGTYSATLTGLTTGTTYTALVAAYNTMGRGPSASTSFTVQRLTIASLIDVTLNTGTVSLESQTAQGLPITYTVEASAACSVSGSTVSLLAVGKCNLLAESPGRETPTVVLAASSRGSFNVLPNPATAPGVVETLTVTPGNGQLTLNWFAPSNNGGANITDYVVQYKTGSSWIPYTDGLSAVTGAVLAGLQNGTSHNLRVAAVNSAGQGPWSSTVTAAPRTTPGAVTGLSATHTSGQTSASLSFTAPGSDGYSTITSYTIEFKEQSASSWTVATTTRATDTSTSVTVTGLDGSKSYDFRVAAVNAAGTSAWTSTTNLQATTSAASLVLTWTQPTFTGSGTLVRYDILYRKLGDSAWDTKTGTTSTSYTLNELTNGDTYEVRVAAITTDATSSYTSLITGTPVTTPAVPRNVTVTPSARQLLVSWLSPLTNGGSAVTDYTITYKAKSAGSWTTLVDGVSTLNTAAITLLQNGTEYDVRVAAVNAQGTGSASDTVTATPRTTPDAPTIETVTGGSNQLLVKWAPPVVNGGAPVTTYRVQYKPTLEVNWTTYLGNLPGETSTVIEDLDDDTAYSVRVAAINAAGPGTYSSTGVATTNVGCSNGTLSFTGATRRNSKVDLDNPNRCYRRSATIGVDSNGNALSARFLIPAGAVVNRTEINIEVVADAPSLLKGLPAVRVTAVDSVTAQAVNTFSEPVSITLVGDPTALPSVSTDGGVTWRRLQQRTSAQVKALGVTGDGYSVSGSTFTIYTMHLTDFALVEAQQQQNNSNNSGNTGGGGSSSTMPMVSTTPVTIQGPTSERVLTCVSPQWSQTPQSLRFDWQGVTPLNPLATGTDTATAIQLPPGFTGPVQCQVIAYANHATGTTQETIKVVAPKAPVAEPTLPAKAATMTILLKFGQWIGAVNSVQRSRLAAALAAPRSLIQIAAGATGTSKSAVTLAKARALAVSHALRSLGYTGSVRMTAKGNLDRVIVTALG